MRVQIIFYSPIKMTLYRPMSHLIQSKDNPKRGIQEFSDFTNEHGNPGLSPHGLEIAQVVTWSSKLEGKEDEFSIGVCFSIDTLKNARVVATCAHCLNLDQGVIVGVDGTRKSIKKVFFPDDEKLDLALVLVDWGKENSASPLPIATDFKNGDLAGAYRGGELGHIELNTYGCMPSLSAVGKSDGKGNKITIHQKSIGEHTDMAFGILEGGSEKGTSGSPVFNNEGVFGMAFTRLENNEATAFIPINIIMEKYNHLKSQIISHL